MRKRNVEHCWTGRRRADNWETVRFSANDVIRMSVLSSCAHS